MFAGATTAVAGSSLIVSQRAHADSGSEPCRFDFTSDPVASFTAVNGFLIDFVTIRMSTITGDCPCGTRTSVEYSYAVDAPNGQLQTSGWVTGSSQEALADLFPLFGGSATVYVGVRVTCSSPAGTAVRCRYGQATASVGFPYSERTGSVTLGTNNGDGGPARLPSCDASARLSSRSSAAATQMYPGAGIVPDQVRENPDEEASIDLIEPTAPEQTTTTTEPAAEPDESSTTTTSPPTTTTSPATTTTAPPSTTSPSTTTTAPPSTTTPPSTSSTTSLPNG